MTLWGNADDKTSTGTVTIDANGLCTGTATLLDTEAALGDFILTTDNVKYMFIEISSNLISHVQSGILGGAIATCVANDFTLSEGPKYVAASHVADDSRDVFGVNSAEQGINFGTIIATEITFQGSGYFANAVVTVSGGGGASGTANAEANSTGYIDAINITAAGSGYETPPLFAVAGATAQTFNSESAVVANGFISIGSNVYQVNDLITYDVTSDNTAIAELVDGNQYYIQAANTTGVYLADEADGTAITLTDGPDEAGHSLTGETAIVVSRVGGSQGAQHSGWVKRTVGTGNKAGRVYYETLVAMNTIVGDAADDAELPDS